MTVTWLNWICPQCKTENRDDVDDELGPFLSCTCDGCGKSFDQSDVELLAQPTTKEREG